jgi:hypothetical protein
MTSLPAPAGAGGRGRSVDEWPFKWGVTNMACAYAASQGWLIVQDDMLMLATEELAAA